MTESQRRPQWRQHQPHAKAFQTAVALPAGAAAVRGATPGGTPAMPARMIERTMGIGSLGWGCLGRWSHPGRPARPCGCQPRVPVTQAWWVGVGGGWGRRGDMHRDNAIMTPPSTPQPQPPPHTPANARVHHTQACTKLPCRQASRRRRKARGRGPTPPPTKHVQPPRHELRYRCGGKPTSSCVCTSARGPLGRSFQAPPQSTLPMWW